MKTGIPILAAALALTVFLTSLVLETQKTGEQRASVRSVHVDAVLAGTKGLLTNYQNKGSILLSAETDGKPNEPLQDLLDEAQNLVNAGNLEAAAEVMRRALKLDEENVNLVASLAAVHFARHEYALAEAYLQRLVKANVELDLTSRSRLGVAQMRQGKYEVARKNLSVVLEQQPNDGALHFALACTHAELNNQQSALYHLELAYAKMGLSLLNHISDPHLDRIREAEEFQRVVHALRSLDQSSPVQASVQTKHVGE